MVFFSSWFKASTKEPSGVTLVISLGGQDLGYLSFRDGNYCLEYLPAFLDSGLLPFNPNDVQKGELPEVDKIYTSPELWHAFSSRLPSPTRDDFNSLLRDLNIANEDDLLVILSKVGKVSIGKPWQLELREKKRA